MPVKTNIRAKRRAHASVGPNPAITAIGDRVRAVRVASGMTQEELALVAGVGGELVIQFENGKPGVSLGRASQVLAALGLCLRVEER